MSATTREKLYSDAPDGAMVWGKHTRRLPDGANQTILLSETREQDYATWMDGTTAAMFGIVADDDGEKYAAINWGGRIEPYLSSDKFGGTGARLWGPSSEHPGFAMHLFGSFAVREPSDSIDAEVYAALITREG